MNANLPTPRPPYLRVWMNANLPNPPPPLPQGLDERQPPHSPPAPLIWRSGSATAYYTRRIISKSVFEVGLHMTFLFLKKL